MTTRNNAHARAGITAALGEIEHGNKPAGHTQGPWKLYDRGDGQTYSRFRVDYSDGESRSVLANDARKIESVNADLLAALEELRAIGEAGVIERRETGKPTWSALDAVKEIARAAIAKARGEA